MVTKELLHIFRNNLYKNILLFNIFVAILYSYMFKDSAHSIKMNIYLCAIPGIIWTILIPYVWSGENVSVIQYFCLPFSLKRVIIWKDSSILFTGIFVQLFSIIIFFLILIKIKVLFLLNVYAFMLLFYIEIFTTKNFLLHKIVSKIEVNSSEVLFSPPSNSTAFNNNMFYIVNFYLIGVIYYFLFPINSDTRVGLFVILLIILGFLYFFSLFRIETLLMEEREDFISNILDKNIRRTV
jgi:hypothetical protein